MRTARIRQLVDCKLLFLIPDGHAAPRATHHKCLMASELAVLIVIYVEMYLPRLENAGGGIGLREAKFVFKLKIFNQLCDFVLLSRKAIVGLPLLIDFAQVNLSAIGIFNR